MSTILWTYQRTGGTTLKKKLRCAGAIFGLEGEFANASPQDVPEIIEQIPSFKMAVGETANWTIVPAVIAATLEHKHIFLYRRNSTDRILSWYLMISTGATSPKKMAINQTNIEAFLARNEIPIDILIAREISDLTNLNLALNMIKQAGLDYEIVSYEDLYNPIEGYGTRDIYTQLSGYNDLRDQINNNELIKHLKSRLI